MENPQLLIAGLPLLDSSLDLYPSQIYLPISYYSGPDTIISLVKGAKVRN